MHAEQITKLLRRARQHLGATQKEMAERVGVSHRLWAEVERGERPNVSLETALRMLSSVGLQVRLDRTTDLPRESSELVARRARAAHRRATWTGGWTRRGEDDEPSADGLEVSERLGAVAMVSQPAYAVADGATSGRVRVAESTPANERAEKPGAKRP